MPMNPNDCLWLAAAWTARLQHWLLGDSRLKKRPPQFIGGPVGLVRRLTFGYCDYFVGSRDNS